MSIFIDNKYTRWYYAIISNVQSRITLGYVEKHHIIPKSLGGLNNKDNLVKLTAREHFICHWLLTKMVDDKSRVSMAYAFMKMANQCNRQQKRYLVPARTYEIISQRIFTEDWRNKLSTAAKLRAVKESELRSQRMAEQHKSGMFKNNKKHRGANNTFAKFETKEKIRIANLSKYGVENPSLVPYKCEHCGKVGNGIAGYKRWHGDNCRSKSTK
jgi:hypothetical protein